MIYPIHIYKSFPSKKILKLNLLRNLFLVITLFFAACPLSFGQGVEQPPMVRLIYFLPSDRQPQPDIDAKMDVLIKSVQQFFADVMESHGFDRKTFTFETDATGQAVVHHVNGQFIDVHYHHQNWNKVWDEIDQHFNTSRDVYLVALDISRPILLTGDDYGTCGKGAYYGTAAGRALMPASGHCFAADLAAHELGHAFGLRHDRRKNPKIIPVQYNTEILERTDTDTMLTSFCAAERLDVHPVFNTNRWNQNSFNQNATVDMLPPQAALPDAVRLRFTVTDADGLHQARVLVGEMLDMIGCKTLQSKSLTLEFGTDLLTPKINRITLEVIDIDGNATLRSFPIDIVPLLPPPEVVLIPDPHLATAVQETLRLAPDSVITTHAMLDLYDLLVSDRQITDLTGLEYARNLQWLALGPGVYGNPGETVNSNKISDLSAIAGLTNLRTLWLSYCYVSDISALVTSLAGLTQLVDLGLNGNAISDVSALAALTQLKYLSLNDNAISDVSALAALTQLKYLSLNDNAISDISALSNLTRMETLHLSGNPITDRSTVQTLLKQNPSLDVYIDLHIPTDTNVPEIEGGDNITGPWLWMIAPAPPGQGGAASINVDSLAAASDGTVTEADIAKSGANEGDAVGHLTWTLAEMRKTGPFFTPSDNITDVVHRIGWAEDDVDHHSSYALITLESATEQTNVIMSVGSDDAIKVWLNGEVVHNNPVNRGSSGFQDNFPVNLIQGDNLLLVKVSEAIGHWSMFVGIDAEVTATYKPISPTEQVTPDRDVNQDGQINILDLVLVAQQLGETTPSNPRADINSDGEVNILDLVLVASAFGENVTPAAP